MLTISLYPQKLDEIKSFLFLEKIEAIEKLKGRFKKRNSFAKFRQF